MRFIEGNLNQIPTINIELREKTNCGNPYSAKLGLYSPQNFKT